MIYVFKDYQLIKKVYLAKHDMNAADDLIREYLPFIRSEISKTLKHFCSEHQDEFSIAMIAFHEAILGYSKEKGTFLSYASLLIHNRLIDFLRKENRHYNEISLDAQCNEDATISLIDQIADEKIIIDEKLRLEATQNEINELQNKMTEFGVTFNDLAQNTPKQDRTLFACNKAIQFAIEHPHILDELLQTHRLPLAELVEGSGVERKTLERHRKYLVTMLLIQTNGYEIIRNHLHYTLKKKGNHLS